MILERGGIEVEVNVERAGKLKVNSITDLCPGCDQVELSIAIEDWDFSVGMEPGSIGEDDVMEVLRFVAIMHVAKWN